MISPSVVTLRSSLSQPSSSDSTGEVEGGGSGLGGSPDGGFPSKVGESPEGGIQSGQDSDGGAADGGFAGPTDGGAADAGLAGPTDGGSTSRADAATANAGGEGDATDEGDVSVASARRARLTVVGTSAIGQPEEGASVDIELRATMGTAPGRLVSINDQCESRSGAMLHCRLGRSGTVSFDVERSGRHGGRATIVATSGALDAHALVHIESEIGSGAKALEIRPISDSLALAVAESLPMSGEQLVECEVASPPFANACDGIVRPLALRIALLGDDLGASGSVAAREDIRIRVETLRNTGGDALRDLGVKLGTNPTCASRVNQQQMYVSIPEGSSVSNVFYACLPATATLVSLSAWADDGSNVMGTLDFRVPAAPYYLEELNDAKPGEGDAGDAGSTRELVLLAHDCAGKPVGNLTYALLQVGKASIVGTTGPIGQTEPLVLQGSARVLATFKGGPFGREAPDVCTLELGGP